MRIKKELHNAQNKTFVFMWVPSHKGIEGNEHADLLANAAADLPRLSSDLSANAASQEPRTPLYLNANAASPNMRPDDGTLSANAATNREITNLSANAAAVYHASENILENHPITLKDMKSRIKKYHSDIVNDNWNRIDPTKNKLRKLRVSLGRIEGLKQLRRRDAVKITRLRLGHTRLTHGHIMTKEDPSICNCGEVITVEHIFNSCKLTRKARKEYKIENIFVLNEDTKFKDIIKFIKKIRVYNDI